MDLNLEFKKINILKILNGNRTLRNKTGNC